MEKKEKIINYMINFLVDAPKLFSLKLMVRTMLTWSNSGDIYEYLPMNQTYEGTYQQTMINKYNLWLLFSISKRIDNSSYGFLYANL